VGTYGRATEPRVVAWFRAYCWFQVSLSVGFGLVGLYMFLVRRGLFGYYRSSTDYEAVGFFLLISALVWGGASFLGTRVAPDAAAWTLGLVLIALGLTSCCLPLCLPLLIFWLKPETQQFFGRRT